MAAAAESRHRRGGADPDLACARIGEESDVVDTLTQLVDHDRTSPYERLAVHRGGHALRRTVKQRDAQCLLQLGDSVGDGGLSHG